MKEIICEAKIPEYLSDEDAARLIKEKLLSRGIKVEMVEVSLRAPRNYILPAALVVIAIIGVAAVSVVSLVNPEWGTIGDPLSRHIIHGEPGPDYRHCETTLNGRVCISHPEEEKSLCPKCNPKPED